MMLQLSPAGAKPLWDATNKEIRGKFQPPILDRGFVYIVSQDGLGTVKCMKWPTGEVAWAAKQPKQVGFGGSLVRVGDQLIVMSQDGKLYLMNATPEKNAVVSEMDLFPKPSDKSKIWSTPLVYHGKLYAKGEKELVCLDISKK